MNEEDKKDEVKDIGFQKCRIDQKDWYVNWATKELSKNEDGSNPVSLDNVTKSQVNQAYWEFRKYDKSIPLHKTQKDFFHV